MKPRVLIADSDVELGEVYRMFLVRQGYAVDTATHGLECVEKLRRSMPAALVLDLELPWGGGDGVLGWLRDERLSVPVILTATAGWSPGVAEELVPPAVAFFPKPFSLTALSESVRVAVAKSKSSEPRTRHAGSELFIG
jgi:DNA-binding NtrC family response regulator